MTTIVLAEDHHIVRQGLRALLEAQHDLQLIGETGDGLEAVQLAERLQPDVLVLDLMMPSLNGLEVTRQVHKRFPNIRIVILSMHSNEAYVLEALRNGATGYVLKDSSAADLVRAIREVTAGRRYLSPPLSDHAIEAYLQQAQDVYAEDPYDTLTNREREVFQLVAEGHSNKEIAARLSISPRTAETHRANMMHKLGLKSKTELIHYAVRRGILLIDE